MFQWSFCDRPTTGAIYKNYADHGALSDFDHTCFIALITYKLLSQLITVQFFKSEAATTVRLKLDRELLSRNLKINTIQIITNTFRKTHVFEVGRTGAVVSVADYEPRGPRFETWPRQSLLWPWASHIYPLLSTG